MLATSLKAAGVQVIALPALGRSRSTEVDVVHLHWLESLAPSDGSRPLGAALTGARAAKLALTLRTLHRRGVAVVWTVHNLRPHEPVHPRLERMLARAVLAASDQAIVHSEHARARTSEHLGHRDKLNVIPHGNYVGAHPPARRSRGALREELGLPPDVFVYLSFGQVRAYKRLPVAIAAFRSIRDEGVRLLIAGEPRDAEEAARVRRLAAADHRILLDLRHIPDDEVADLHSVADAAILPYRELFSSGALLLALSLALPVVAPRRGTAHEVAAGPALESFDENGLLTALIAVRRGDQLERRRAALAAAERFDWHDVAARTADVYRRAIARRLR